MSVREGNFLLGLIHFSPRRRTTLPEASPPSPGSPAAALLSEVRITSMTFSLHQHSHRMKMLFASPNKQQNDAAIIGKSRLRRRRGKQDVTGDAIATEVPVSETSDAPSPTKQNPDAAQPQHNCDQEITTAGVPKGSGVTPWMALSSYSLRNDLTLLYEDIGMSPEETKGFLMREQHCAFLKMMKTLDITQESLVERLQRFAAETPRWMITPPVDTDGKTKAPTTYLEMRRSRLTPRLVVSILQYT